MSIGDQGICVRILEKEFRIACSKGQEKALRDAAQYLDKQMRQIRQAGRVIGIERIAVMAALNITNELLVLKSTPSEPDAAFSDRLKVLQEKIDSVLAQESQRRDSELLNQSGHLTKLNEEVQDQLQLAQENKVMEESV
jgi:cell division protein ZapA